MKPVVPILFAASLLPAWQQALPPEKPLARVNDETVTVAKLADLLTGAPSLAVNSASSDPVEFLTWTYLLSKMSADAEKQGLGKKSPYVDRMNWNQSQVLMMARIEEKNRESTPDEKENEVLYRENPHRYGTAQTKLIFIPAGPTAKATMDSVAAQANKGIDFVKLVKQYSADQDSVAKDGDFAEITPASRMPEAIRKIIFTTKPGQLTPVFSQPAGFYLFKVMAVAMRPIEELGQEMGKLTGQQRASEWMAEEKKKASVKIVHEEFFKSLKVTAGDMASGAAGNINLQATPQTAEIKPTTLLAEINGKPMTAADYTNLVKALSPQVRTKAIVAPSEFLRDYAFMLTLVDDAKRLGLDQKQPYRNRLSYDRNMALMQANVDEYLNNIVVSLEDQKAGYAADPTKYRFANTRVLYIAYSLTPPPQTDVNAPKVLNEQEALAKIEGILKEYREKKDDFAGYVLRFSEDQRSRDEGGVMRPISYADPQVPEHIRQAIFGAKPGEVVGPIKMANGFYLFKVDLIDVRKYEEVKDQIYEELRQQRFQDWFNQQRASLKVTVEDPDGFRQTVAQAR
jgi:parvulin-like peptidyl-prolyl isomerase